MRRNARLYNLRRFLSVGLAAVLVATAVPINTLAADEASTSTNEASVTATTQAETNTGDASDTVDDASKTLAAIETLPEEDKATVEEIQKSLTSAEGYLTENVAKDEDGNDVGNNVKSNLSDAASFMDAGMTAEGTGDEAIISANKAADNYSNAAMTYNNNVQTVSAGSAGTVSSASIANNSNVESEARAAAQDAANQYAAAEAGLTAAEQAYVDAKAAADELQTQVEAAEKEYEKAQAEYDKAQSSLNSASSNVAAAKSELENAKANAEALKAKAENYEKTVEDLDTCCDLDL